MVGADICGFVGSTTVELCARWTSLGAFYPFSRNHNEDHSIDQDPVSLGPIVVSAAKFSLSIRYSLLPYLYTLLYENSISGRPVVRSLLFEYPKLTSVYKIEDQFLWGSDVMIIPVVTEGATGRQVFFPPGKWYDFTNKTSSVTSDSGKSVWVDIPIDKIKVFLKAGSVIPIHKPEQTTTQQRKGNFSLIVSLDGKTEAKGQLCWDDGDSIHSNRQQEYSLVKFNVSDSSLTSTPVVTGYSEGMVLANVTILGLFPDFNTQVTIDNQQLSPDAMIMDRGFLTLTNLNKNLLEKFTVSWKL